VYVHPIGTDEAFVPLHVKAARVGLIHSLGFPTAGFVGPGGTKTSAKTGDIIRKAKDRANIAYTLFTNLKSPFVFSLLVRMIKGSKNGFTLRTV
jgi:hypothetical protein